MKERREIVVVHELGVCPLLWRFAVLIAVLYLTGRGMALVRDICDKPPPMEIRFKE